MCQFVNINFWPEKYFIGGYNKGMNTNKSVELILNAIQRNMLTCDRFEKKLNESGKLTDGEISLLIHIIKRYNNIICEIYAEYDDERTYIEQ